jgi:LysR family transcriptional regulator for metE and metH
MHQENLLNNSEYLTADDFVDVHLIIHSFPLKTVSVYERFLNPNEIMPVKISAVPLTEVTLNGAGQHRNFIKWALKSFRLSDELKFKKIGSNGLKESIILL